MQVVPVITTGRSMVITSDSFCVVLVAVATSGASMQVVALTMQVAGTSRTGVYKKFIFT